MREFEYRKVSTLQDAFRLLEEHGEGARILAGGTDLLVKMRNRILTPRLLIDLKGVPDLEAISYDPESGLRIGALTTIHRMETSPLLREKFGVIAQAASSLGSYQIRCRATLGGNLCNASPAADMIPCFISLGAKAEIAGPKRERFLPLEDFFAAPGRTHLRPGEILTAVQVPQLSELTGTHYAKHSIRKAMDLAVVGVAVALSFDLGRERCSDAKIALGAVGPIPFRATRAESCLRSQRMDEELISQAALLASEEAQPISDIRASGEYRKEMVRVVTHRALKQAWTNLLEGRTPS
ncbi:MAG: xanthine dehydrogenase family protein subunit M [Pseudomonadota bacterium]